MAKSNSPIPWFGGKANLARRLIDLFPPHQTYVEPFGGSAAVLLTKPPSSVEVYNDLDSGLVNFFRVLRDPDKAARLHMLASHTPHSREEWLRYRESWSSCEDDVEQAYQWFVVAQMSFSGKFGSAWGFARTHTTRGMASSSSRWISSHATCARAHERLIRVQIEHKPAAQVIERFDTADTLFYLDPPYVPDTRKSGSYAHELTADDHRQLVEALLAVQGKVIMSGYASDLYKPLEAAGWKRQSWQVQCSAVGRTRAAGLIGTGSTSGKHQRTECVWISPSAQQRQRSTSRPNRKSRPAPKAKLAITPHYQHTRGHALNSGLSLVRLTA